MSHTRRAAADLLASGGRIFVDRRGASRRFVVLVLVALAGVAALAAVLWVVRW